MDSEQDSRQDDTRAPPSERRFTLKPAYKQDDPNPHAHSRGPGRNELPTPATLAGKLWDSLGIQSHLALTVFLLPLSAFIFYLYTTRMDHGLLAMFIGSAIASYGIYYSWAPRESKPVIARLEHAYHAKQYARAASGIAVMSLGGVAFLIAGLLSEVYMPVRVAETSITIATFGMGIGLLSSYILVRVLVAKALPVRSNEPIIDRLIGLGTIVEVVCILASIGAPLFILAGQFLWNRPALVTIDMTIPREVASVLLSGFGMLYTALITRM